MGVLGGINQQTNALDIIVGHTDVILLVPITSPNIVCIGATWIFPTCPWLVCIDELKCQVRP
jgi:hypothetical protein